MRRRMRGFLVPLGNRGEWSPSLRVCAPLPPALSVTIKVESREITVTGPRGSLTRSFKHIAIAAVPLGKHSIRFDMWFGNRLQVRASAVAWCVRRRGGWARGWAVMIRSPHHFRGLLCARGCCVPSRSACFATTVPVPCVPREFAPVCDVRHLEFVVCGVL